MKYFAKKEIDNSFGGWYLPEVHETMFENGIPKFNGIEFTEEQYNQIMSNLKGELRFNNQGQLIDYIKKPMPEGMINGKYDYSTETWTETLTLEEQLEYYKQEMLSITKELLVYKETGFDGRFLETKYQELLKKHNEISQELASQENNFPAKRTKKSLLYNI